MFSNTLIIFYIKSIALKLNVRVMYLIKAVLFALVVLPKSLISVAFFCRPGFRTKSRSIFHYGIPSYFAIF